MISDLGVLKSVYRIKCTLHYDLRCYQIPFWLIHRLSDWNLKPNCSTNPIYSPYPKTLYADTLDISILTFPIWRLWNSLGIGDFRKGCCRRMLWGAAWVSPLNLLKAFELSYGSLQNETKLKQNVKKCQNRQSWNSYLIWWDESEINKYATATRALTRRH